MINMKIILASFTRSCKAFVSLQFSTTLVSLANNNKYHQLTQEERAIKLSIEEIKKI